VELPNIDVFDTPLQGVSVRLPSNTPKKRFPGTEGQAFAPWLPRGKDEAMGADGSIPVSDEVYNFWMNGNGFEAPRIEFRQAQWIAEGKSWVTDREGP